MRVVLARSMHGELLHAYKMLIGKQEDYAKLFLMAVKMSMLVFWVATPSGRVDRYQRFGGTYCLHLQGWG
jgi:hypothetical protein